jgi:hypothetical protein
VGAWEEFVCMGVLDAEVRPVGVTNFIPVLTED